MEHDGVKTDTVQEAQAKSQFIQLREYGASNLDDGKLGGLRRVG